MTIKKVNHQDGDGLDNSQSNLAVREFETKEEAEVDGFREYIASYVTLHDGMKGAAHIHDVIMAEMLGEDIETSSFYFLPSTNECPDRPEEVIHHI